VPEHAPVAWSRQSNRAVGPVQRLDFAERGAQVGVMVAIGDGANRACVVKVLFTASQANRKAQIGCFHVTLSLEVRQCRRLPIVSSYLDIAKH
jgi:hypothetical protein